MAKVRNLKTGFDDKTKDGGYTRAVGNTPSNLKRFVLKCYDMKDKLHHKHESIDYNYLKQLGANWNSVDPTNWSSLRDC